MIRFSWSAIVAQGFFAEIWQSLTCLRSPIFDLRYLPMTPWAERSQHFYGGLARLNNKFNKCAWCQCRHTSNRWWGREKERDGRCLLPAFLWCNICHVHLHRKVAEPETFPRHPGWLKLSEHIDERDNTGSLIRAGHYRPDLQALRVFWVLCYTLLSLYALY